MRLPNIGQYGIHSPFLQIIAFLVSPVTFLKSA